jgi:hypothetical protein
VVEMKIKVVRRRPRHPVPPSAERAALEHAGARRQAVTPRVREHVTRLVVEVGSCANAWREAAVDAELAYRWWRDAAWPERADAAAVYLAAIEREEKAAAEYCRALEACYSASPRATGGAAASPSPHSSTAPAWLTGDPS